MKLSFLNFVQEMFWFTPSPVPSLASFCYFANQVLALTFLPFFASFYRYWRGKRDMLIRWPWSHKNCRKKTKNVLKGLALELNCGIYHSIFLGTNPCYLIGFAGWYLVGAYRPYVYYFFLTRLFVVCCNIPVWGWSALFTFAGYPRFHYCSSYMSTGGVSKAVLI